MRHHLSYRFITPNTSLTAAHVIVTAMQDKLPFDPDLYINYDYVVNGTNEKIQKGFEELDGRGLIVPENGTDVGAIFWLPPDPMDSEDSDVFVVSHLYAKKSDARIGTQLIRKMLHLNQNARQIILKSKNMTGDTPDKNYSADEFYIKMGFLPVEAYGQMIMIMNNDKISQWRITPTEKAPMW